MIRIDIVLIVSAIIAFFSLLYCSMFEFEKSYKYFKCIAIMSIIILISSIGSWVGLTKFGTKYEEQTVADITEIESISSMSYMYKGEQIHLGTKIKYNNKDYFKDIFYPVSHENQDELNSHVLLSNKKYKNKLVRTDKYYKLFIFNAPDFEDWINEKMKIGTSKYSMYIDKDMVENLDGYNMLNLK